MGKTFRSLVFFAILRVVLLITLLISQNPQALQLRYLQTLNDISNENSTTIVFPLPMDLIQALMGKKE